VHVNEPDDDLIYHVKNSYDLAGRLIDVCEPLLTENYQLIAGFDYDDNGNRDTLTYYRNGSATGPTISIGYGYNPDNLLTDFTTTGGPTFTFDATDSGDIDGLGRLKSADETISKTSGTVDYSYTYVYDMRSQLKEADITRDSSSWWDADYTYYKDGNLDTQQETGMVEPAIFDYDFQNPDDGDIMTGAHDGKTFTLGWDWNGNMTSTTLNSGLDFTYNWDNKLRKVEQSTTVIMSVKYDPGHNRIFKDSSESGERKYIVDVTGKLPVILMELNTSGGIEKTYIYADRQIIAQHDGDHTEDRYFYLHDRLGSVRQVIDNSASVVKYYTYQSFGETIDDGGTFDDSFRFTGQYFDSEIKEYYLRARMYDPNIGRFTSRDPVRGKFSEPMALHKYLYCLNDPINKIDPTGKQPWIDGEEIEEEDIMGLDFEGLLDIHNNLDLLELSNLDIIASMLLSIEYRIIEAVTGVPFLSLAVDLAEIRPYFHQVRVLGMIRNAMINALLMEEFGVDPDDLIPLSPIIPDNPYF
jgi:RHS repeat-associated protein